MICSKKLHFKVQFKADLCHDSITSSLNLVLIEDQDKRVSW